MAWSWPGGRKRARIPARRLPAAALTACVLLVLVGAPAAYGASTLQVNAATGVDSGTCGTTTPCQTIGQAVANASPGDTIQVAAGTYAEAVTIDKSLTLEGAQAGNAGSASRAGSPSAESVVSGGNVFIAATDVTLDGFSLTYPGNQVCVACSTGTVGSASDVTIENNVFNGYEPDNFGDYQVTSALGVNAAPDTRITGNYFTSPDHAVVGAVQFFNGGCTGTVVSDNTFDAAANDGLGTIFFYCDDQASTGITVSGNHDIHVGDSNGESAIIFEHVVGDIHVTGNTVTESSTSGSAFYFTLSASLGAVDISGNSVVGSASSSITIRPTGGGTGVYTVTGNRLSGGKYGLYAYSSSLASGATVTLRGNDISGDFQDGVFNDPASGGSIDAIDNWWGCNGGPGASGCTVVSGDVTFDPWLVLGVSASPTSVAAGGHSRVTADLTRNSNGDDTSSSGTLPDGTSVDFATDLGNLSSTSAGTSGGKASVIVSSLSAGTAHVSATLDNETGSAAVSFAQFTGSPTIGSFSPGSGAAHSTVTVTGTNLSTVTSVLLGSVNVPFSKVSSTKLTFTVPAGAGDGQITVINPAGSATSSGTFTVLPPPAIASFTPGSGAVGAVVTITGTNLGSAVGVRLGRVIVVPTSVTATQVVFKVPAGAVSGQITILAANGSAVSALTFTVTP
jgi:hypothetical protein